jgi:hypothetical protein
VPQLDIYIIFELVYTVLIFFLILLILNIKNILINIYTNLKSGRLKYFIEKTIIFLTGSESYGIKNNYYLKSIIPLQIKTLIKIINNIFNNEIFDAIKKKLKIKEKELITIKKENKNKKENKRKINF